MKHKIGPSFSYNLNGREIIDSEEQNTNICSECKENTGKHWKSFNLYMIYWMKVFKILH